jgi:hypothetical protein
LFRILQEEQDVRRASCFFDPPFPRRPGRPQGVKTTLQSDQDQLAAGLKQGAAFKARLDQATAAGLDALG